MTHAPPALSDLSATEFLSLTRVGFLPRGLVTGICVYDSGYNANLFSNIGLTTREIPEIGQSMHAARAAALQKMRAEARALGADGVVGVRVDVDKHTWRGGQVVARFVAVGTAIGPDPTHTPRDLAHAPSLRLTSGPFASDLSAHDFTTLLRAGFRPIDLAMGNCVYQLAPQLLSGLTLGNVELSNYTAAFAEARDKAMSNLVYELTRHYPAGSFDAPVGVVGMNVTEGAHGGGTNMIEFTALGTAVARLADSDPRRAAHPPAPIMVMPLDA